MHEDLDKKSCEKYPEIFRNRHEPVTKTPMGWGFECGDGWYDLIDTLCHNIQHYIDWENKYPKAHAENIEQVVASQVKEKFGGLRFYIDYNGDETIRGMITMAESMSYHICEECGDRGKSHGSGWIRTLCDRHAAKYEYRELDI